MGRVKPLAPTIHSIDRFTIAETEKPATQLLSYNSHYMKIGSRFQKDTVMTAGTNSGITV
jgi:hypothetical protein